MPYYLAGIDEAGYGPTLGPLVISAVVFKTQSPQTNLTKLLRRIVSPHPRTNKLTVCDSKKIYSPAIGLGPLEKTALVFLGQRYPDIFNNGNRLTAQSILEKIIPGFPECVRRLPWYQNAELLSLPLQNDEAVIKQSAGRLAEELKQKSLELCEIRIQLVSASQFNQGINQYQNKAELLFNQTGRLLSYLHRQYLSRPGGSVYAGKQGGRAYYQSHLNNLFGTNEVKTVKETAAGSVYQIGTSGRLEFVRDGEDRHFTIALASIFSKYVRELFMALFNNFWQKHCPGLKPTAGYPVDAKRFLNEIGFFIKKLNLEKNNLIRVR